MILINKFFTQGKCLGFYNETNYADNSDLFDPFLALLKIKNGSTTNYCLGTVTDPLTIFTSASCIHKYIGLSGVNRKSKDFQRLIFYERNSRLRSAFSAVISFNSTYYEDLFRSNNKGLDENGYETSINRIDVVNENLKKKKLPS